jgi:bis(5'-nucleosyl)-tetraphosphatase (symmetrical)
MTTQTAQRTFVIGDLQGCFSSLTQLLQRIDHQPTRDHIYLLGDIINRGPESLACLRWAAQTPNLHSVLGNHDLHLLAVASGNERYHHTSDTLRDILSSPDKDSLINWLRHQPLLIHLAQFNTTLVHAGVMPHWTLTKAQSKARRVETILQSDEWQSFAGQHLYGNHPTNWSKTLPETDALRYIINTFARMRLCGASGELEFKHKLGMTTYPKGFKPWFTYPRKDDSFGRILFGHWSTLGTGVINNTLCLDTGCLWGGTLSALQLETNELITIPCPTYTSPESCA